MTFRCCALAALVALPAACTQELEGAPCPCAEGFVCCEAEAVCRAGADHCLADLTCGSVHAPVCGPRSHCVDGPEGGECACDEGYHGQACDQCMDGFVRSEDRCLPQTLLPYCERDGGCEECAEVVYCNTPADVAENRGTWCRQRACSREEALADCVNNIVPLCGGATAEPFFMEFAKE